jgi:RNA polymerase sigma factor (sigma-70 family)
MPDREFAEPGNARRRSSSGSRALADAGASAMLPLSVRKAPTRPGTQGSPRSTGDLLNGRLRLGEVESAELFCRQVLEDRLRRMGAFLNPTEYEDCLSYLVADAWALWQRYDPAKGSRFSTFAYRILSRRVASWYRQRFQDGRYMPRVTWVSLDEELDAAVAASVAVPADAELHSRINVQALTPEARLVLERIARPMVEEEITQDELAVRFGQPRSWVTRGLQRLKEELEPMLAEDDGRTGGRS